MTFSDKSVGTSQAQRIHLMLCNAIAKPGPRKDNDPPLLDYTMAENLGGETRSPATERCDIFPRRCENHTLAHGLPKNRNVPVKFVSRLYPLLSVIASTGPQEVPALLIKMSMVQTV